MPEETFWRCTLHKLFATLFEVHKKVNGLQEPAQDMPSAAYLDQFI